jgi:Ca2+-binding EF-hand superfamily protein
MSTFNSELLPPASASRVRPSTSGANDDGWRPTSNTPVYLATPTNAAKSVQQQRPVSAAGGLANQGTTLTETYDAEKTVDALMEKFRVKAFEKSNCNPNLEVQSRALQALLRQFGSGETITRRTLESTISFMALQLRPRAADALFARINPTSATDVSFRDAARILVGLDVPPRAKPEVRVTLDAVREKLMNRFPPGHGIDQLRKAYAICDKDRSGSLTHPELVRYFTILGLPLTDHDATVLMEAFDTNRDGTLSFAEFCRAIRGPMTQRRTDLVCLAFAQVDLDGSGFLTVEELGTRYDATKHPDVSSGKKTAEEILAEFLAPWDARDGGKADGIVTRAEFIDYYTDMSATIDDDNYFELMIRNCWHLSGGTGAAENTTCRRVLVTFLDKSQKVVEVKNDLGLRFDKTEDVKRRLMAQGLRDILLVEFK